MAANGPASVSSNHARAGFSSVLIGPLTYFVALSVELAEQAIDERVRDFAGFFLGLQVLLSDIGGVIRFIHQHVIPRFIFRGARAGDLFVPFIRPLKGRIDIENHADVIEQPVVNDLSYLEFCFVPRHGVQ